MLAGNGDPAADVGTAWNAARTRGTTWLKRFGSSPGASRGFGREWAIAALERGDKVAAHRARHRDAGRSGRQVRRRAACRSRSTSTDREADFAAVKAAHDHFGRLDIVVNNAGYGQFGFIEELSEAGGARPDRDERVRRAVGDAGRAAVPAGAAQRHIIQVSSIGGITAFQNVGIYHASKWALEGFSQALAQEVAPFGIHVTLIEPGGFSTDWAGSSSKRSDPAARLRRGARGGRTARSQRVATPGDPKASAAAVLKIVDAEKPPLRVFFGELPLQLAKADYEKPAQDLGRVAAGGRARPGLGGRDTHWFPAL